MSAGSVTFGIVKVFTELDPTGISSAIVTSIEEIKREATEQYIQELVNVGTNITPTLENKKGLIKAQLLIDKALENTYRHDKIKRLAQLFAHYAISGLVEPGDNFEEALKIIEEVSEKEFGILSLLYELEINNPPTADQNAAERVNTYWEEFRARCISDFLMEESEFAGRLERLKRTGLIQGMQYFIMVPRYYLTGVYRQLLLTLGIAINPAWIPIKESEIIAST